MAAVIRITLGRWRIEWCDECNYSHPFVNVYRITDQDDPTSLVFVAEHGKHQRHTCGD